MQPKEKRLSVLAVGASGPSAGLVIPELVKRGASVRGLVHKPEDADKARTLGLDEIVVGDLSDASAMSKALAGMDSAFYIAPAFMENEAEVGIQFVAAAKKAAVKRIVFSAVIHPILSELVNHADKAPVEDALLASGMEYVFLQPAMFFQNFATAWAKTRESGVYAEPWSDETRFSRVDYRDVAEVAAIALTEDRLLYGTFELCAEGHLNRRDVATVMGEVMGRRITPQTIRLPLRGGPPPNLTRMFNWYDKHALLGSALTLRAILGREPRTLKAYFEELNAEV